MTREEEIAHRSLGGGLLQALRIAAILNSEKDRQFIAEVGRRIYDAAPPEQQELFRRWLAPNGALRLWPER